jgi:hypothetical protein
VLVDGGEEVVEAVEEGPGRVVLGHLHLVLLLERVDAILALDVGLGRLGVSVAGGDDLGDLLPLRVAEAAAAERDEALPPGVDQR